MNACAKVIQSIPILLNYPSCCLPIHFFGKAAMASCTMPWQWGWIRRQRWQILEIQQQELNGEGARTCLWHNSALGGGGGDTGTHREMERNATKPKNAPQTDQIFKQFLQLSHPQLSPRPRTMHDTGYPLHEKRPGLDRAGRMGPWATNLG